MSRKLIEKLKHNTTPYGLLSEEEQRCLVAAPVEMWIRGDTWDRAIAGCGAVGDIVYRIQAEYESEPRVVESKVEETKTGWVQYFRAGTCWDLCSAVARKDFIGYKYADGIISRDPRRCHQDRKNPALIPTYVLFAEDDNG